jgi:predicted O-methyltransferase YrrM
MLAPFIVPASLCMKAARRIGLQHLPACRAIMLRIGVMPIRNHYYEPFVASSDLRKPLGDDRTLPGIEWDLPAQVRFLETLIFADEIDGWDAAATSELEFSFINNTKFWPGDAEFLYQTVRSKKPRRLVEIGSGHSTLIARAAIRKNAQEDTQYDCEHVCIEPYEAPWLEKSGARIIRKKVQEVDVAIFSRLQKDDLLFIDSSHVIKPQGDVLTEYLEILPRLSSGVIVHVHDVFSPRDYPKQWVIDQRLLWNEQYLLEAFLTQNREWGVLAALNLLKHSYFEDLKRVCPYLMPEHEPGSFYIYKK